tara:strand:+ start:673 stop:924 length:252 start_codon:yes stop_codon:yes gene_type:complete
MTEEVKNDPVITIDGKEYRIEDLSDKSKRTLAHVADLNTKLIKARFDLEQLEITQVAMKNILANNVNALAEEAQAAAKADSEK